MAEGFLLLFREKLGIDCHFSYKTIERGYDREPINKILDEIVVITNEIVEGEEETFSFDGTGFSASNKDNYADKRQKQNYKKGSKKSKSVSKEQADDSFPESNSTAKKGFSYSVMGIGVKYKLISGISISPDHAIGETTMFPEAFDQTLNCHPNLDSVLGDGIYTCRWITNLVSENNSTPHFLPRSNVTFKTIGALGWCDIRYKVLFNIVWVNLPHFIILVILVPFSLVLQRGNRTTSGTLVVEKHGVPFRQDRTQHNIQYNHSEIAE